MPSIKVSLFGKVDISYGEKKTHPIRARKVQELLIYLLIFRKHPQPRESLSEALWTDQSAVVCRKNLRQTLWHLQSAFKAFRPSSSFELLIDDDWIHIRLPADFWLDTAKFEQVFDLVNHKRARELTPEDFKAMEFAVNLYKGDLLEGWYQDWCVFERERFQLMYLMLLDKLVQYCEIHQRYDAGLAYGWKIMRHDQAYERAHRQMMRLYFMAGDRTQAIYQYQRCVAVLREELGVEPSDRTKQLYEQIRFDTFKPPLFALEKGMNQKVEAAPGLEEMLSRMEEFAGTLKQFESQVQQNISTLQSILASQARGSRE